MKQLTDQVNAMLLSEMQIATLINKHFYVGMVPDYSHYKAFALEALTAAKQQCDHGTAWDTPCRACDNEQDQPERAPLTVDVFYLAGHDPFICGVHGKLTVAALSEIELDVQENPDFKKGDGVYSYSVTRFEGQYGFEGRCELAPEWELVEHKFTPIDAAIKQGGRQ